MTPTLYACYFPDAKGTPWHRFARVLAWSAAAHCAGWTRRIECIEPRAVEGPFSWARENTQKLERWVEVVAGVPDGQAVLLVDVDTMVLRPLDEIWAQPFDLAYTVRDFPIPYNLGVVFLRTSPAVRRFLERWRAINAGLVRDPRPEWRARWGGVNQAAFARALEAPEAAELAIVPVPCHEWNAEESAWGDIDRTGARILHIKGQLRAELLHRAMPTPVLIPLVTRWRDALAQATNAGRP